MGIMKNMVRKPHQHPLRVLTAYPMFSWIYAFFTFIFYLSHYYLTNIVKDCETTKRCMLNKC